jgi:hypothetical protein
MERAGGYRGALVAVTGLSLVWGVATMGLTAWRGDLAEWLPEVGSLSPIVASAALFLAGVAVVCLLTYVVLAVSLALSRRSA